MKWHKPKEGLTAEQLLILVAKDGEVVEYRDGKTLIRLTKGTRRNQYVTVELMGGGGGGGK